ncbi:MAG: hypothetical protein H8F28_12310 [Fibrella sp.]|nr:hypothetical protein [Armatimonadota bacterium]
MNSYDFITFDDTGLSLQGEKDGARVWLTDGGDGVALFHFAKPPDIGADIHSIVDVRNRYRNSAIAAGLGMIEVETPQMDGCVAVRTFF